MTTIINGERFVDMLHDRRKHGDLQWITAEWDSPKYKFYKPRSPQQLKDSVLNSSRVQLAIQEVCAEDGVALKIVTDRAKEILTEMGHNQNLSSIRFVGYFLAKCLKQIYTHVYVSSSGIEKIRSSCTQHPMLFMPTHRSYADFLLMSFMCFHFHIPLPVIAAGLDFLGLKVVRRLLRNCGAFFIRRAFGEDKLYWAIFTEYVQNILKAGDAPMEFFVEGTRSRSAKSLNPRLGLLLAALELYATAQVSDITIVPISISYDRTLEESLYAYELLGVPKPKESTTGLFKARKIFGENFGNIFMTMGNPISLRDFCAQKIDRSIHNLEPRFKAVLRPNEVEVCGQLANRVVKLQQKSLYLSPFPFMALVLAHEHSSGGQGVPYEYLTERVLWLKELAEKTGAFVVINETSNSSWLCETIELHSNIVQLLPDGLVALLPNPKTLQNGPILDKSLALSLETVDLAVPHMYTYHYGNQALQLLAPFAIVALSIVSSGATEFTEDDLFAKFKILRDILQKEFVFESTNTKEDFNFALKVLRNDSLIIHKEGKVSMARQSNDKLSFLAHLLSPFLIAYHFLWQYVLIHSEEISEVPVNSLVRRCQCVIQEDMKTRKIRDYRILALDTLNNGILSMVALGAARKEKRNEKNIVVPIKMELGNILHEIAMFLGVIEQITTISNDATLIPMSKL